MASQETVDSVKDAVQDVADKVKDMTTSEGSAAAQPALLLDEVTGERVSKTELKKRQKQREKDAKKAEKDATKQAPPQPKRKAISQEEEEGKLNANVSIFLGRQVGCGKHAEMSRSCDKYGAFSLLLDSIVSR